jgi:hypothetical protein
VKTYRKTNPKPFLAHIKILLGQRKLHNISIRNKESSKLFLFRENRNNAVK